MAYIQENNPFQITPCGRRRASGVGRGFTLTEESPMQKRKPDVRRTIGPGKNFNKAKSKGTGGAAGGGMTEKGVAEYRRNNPGSKLKTAVTTPPSRLKEGSKTAKRRKSFC